jgi:hypothetical protein
VKLGTLGHAGHAAVTATRFIRRCVMAMTRGTYVVAGIIGLGLSVALPVGIRGGTIQGQATAPKVETVPCVAIPSVDGKENFQHYCAVCHGVDARGNGPAAPALKGPIPDLTTIATRHGGKFDLIEIERYIQGADSRPTAHGTADMPVWGPVFRSATSEPSVTTLRVKNLTNYLKSIQAKPPSD